MHGDLLRTEAAAVCVCVCMGECVGGCVCGVVCVCGVCVWGVWALYVGHSNNNTVLLEIIQLHTSMKVYSSINLVMENNFIKS